MIGVLNYFLKAFKLLNIIILIRDFLNEYNALSIDNYNVCMCNKGNTSTLLTPPPKRLNAYSYSNKNNIYIQ